MAEPNMENTDLMKNTDPMAQLVTGAEVGSAIEHLRLVFSELTDQIRAAPMEQRAARQRLWDNGQRASLGRGETGALVASDIKSSFSLAQTPFEPRGEPGLELPTASEVPAFANLDDIVRLAARLAIPAAFDEQRVIVTLFLYRVLARAGQTYEGFLHRDIASEREPVGSVIFYPTVRTQNIEGAEFGALYSRLPTDELQGSDPDITFAPQDYAGSALVLGYPHNLAHGVWQGKNPHAAPTAAGSRADDVQEFFDPQETTYVKDMAVVTFSQTAAIEVERP